MFCIQAAVMLVCTVKSTCSPNNHSRILVEMDSHVDTCVVGSSVLVVHNFGCYVNIYSFDKETWHQNATTIETAIACKDLVMHASVIIMINRVSRLIVCATFLSVQCNAMYTALWSTNVPSFYPKSH